MRPENAAMLLLMFIVFGVPALAISVRLALKPILEALERVREGGLTVTSRADDPRIEALEAEVVRLTQEVQRLSESEAFHRELMASRSAQQSQ